MVDKFVAVNNAFDECFKKQYGAYPDNDNTMSKDYHFGTTVIHSILLCLKACLSGQGFTFGKVVFDSNLAASYASKKISDVKAAIDLFTIEPVGSANLAEVKTAAPSSAEKQTEEIAGKGRKPKAPRKKRAT